MVPADTIPPVPQPWASHIVSDEDQVMEQVWLPYAEVPRGWRPLGAITVGRSPSAADSKAHEPEIIAYCIDTQSRELLAEFDLAGMYAGLYGLPRSELRRAAVYNASIGPAGAVGLIVCFTRADSYMWDVGLWDDGKWTPLAAPIGNYKPGEIVVGPGNGAIVTYYGAGPAVLLFYDCDGTVLSSMSTSPRQLENLVLRWNQRSAIVAALTGSGALAAVALVALVWWLLPLRRAAQRA
jgi:hypothetical protein